MRTFYHAIALSAALAAGLSAQGLTVGSGTTFSLGGATLSLPNNFADSGRFVAGAGTVVFNGASGNQTISSVSVDTFQNLGVNKASGTVLLNRDIAVRGNLTVTSGDINLSGDTIHMGTAALLSETQGNTVKGVGRIAGAKTVGVPSAQNPFGLGATLTSSVDLGSTTVSRGHVAQTIGADSSILRYFDIQPAVNTGLSATLVFHYDTSELNGVPVTMLCLFSSADSGRSWTPRGGIVDTAARTVTLTGIAQMGRWTLANGGITAVLAPPPPKTTQQPASRVAAAVPRVFALAQNYPNPFRRTTTLQFTLKDDGWTTLKLFDIRGHAITTLVDDELKAGVLHSVSLDASLLAPGTYVYRLVAGGNSQRREMRVVK
jgi:hypothetical protein